MSQRSRIILIVDDSPEDRALYRRYLLRAREYSYTFLEASSGQQGLELWQQQPVDAMLLDYRLPDLEGLELLAQLQAISQQSYLPVIITTGQGNEAIAVQAMKAGAQDYLVKGEITPENLHLAVNEVIETARLHTQQQLEQQRLMMAMTQRIRQSLNLQDILQTTVDEVRQFLQVDRVLLFQFSPAWGGTVTVESVADESLAILPLSIDDPCIGDRFVEPFKQGLVTAKADIYSADLSPYHVEFLAQFQVRANLVVPILKADRLWGLLVANHCTEPRPWQEAEIALLQQIASQVGIALQQAALFEQLQIELRERKYVEEALRQSEQRYRSLFASIDEGFCVIEMLFDDNNTPLDYRFLEANPAFEHQSGLERAVGKTARQLMPNLEDYWFEIFGNVALTGEPIRFDNGAVPTGRWFDVYAFRFEQPPSRNVAIVFKDITQRKQTETALQTFNTELEQRVEVRTAELTAMNERLLVALTEQTQTEAALQQQTQQEQLRWNVTQAIRQSLDLEGILNTAVAEVRQTLQVDRATVYRFQPNWSGDFIVESVSAGWMNLVNPTVPIIWEDTHLQDTQGGRFQRHETFVIADIYAAGLHPCHIALLEQFQAKAYAVAPIFSGTTLWGLLAIYQNATARHWQDWEVELLQQIASQLAIAIQQSELYGQLQVELKERQQATAVIREAERRWRTLLNNVQLLVVGLDQAGTINYVNPFLLSLTGYTHSEVIGKNWFEMCLPRSSQAAIQTAFAEVLAQNAHPYYQNTILTKAGEERCIAWNNTVLQDASGNGTGTISIGEDITERQKVEKMKNEFISIVSHELRTPLTSIRGSLGLLATGVMDDEPDALKRMITIAAIDTERLVRLVNDVLDLEKLESGKISLSRTWCDAGDLMQQSIDVMQSSAQDAGVQLVVYPLALQIWVDPDRIIQTFTNLLSNAIKFSSPGSTVWLRAESVKVGAAEESGEAEEALLKTQNSSPTPHILFSIQDQGRGIPTDKLETIFGRFQQVDASDSRDRGGTGLGLAICQSIVQQHDGQLWVESTWGEGSTFFFTLPLQSR